MKKQFTKYPNKITAATISAEENFMDALEAQASRIGYVIKNSGSYAHSISPDTLTFVSEKNADKMPTIVARAEVDSNEERWYRPDVTFPDLKGSEMDYSDSFEYYLGEWQKVGRLCTWLFKNGYNMNDVFED